MGRGSRGPSRLASTLDYFTNFMHFLKVKPLIIFDLFSLYPYIVEVTTYWHRINCTARHCGDAGMHWILLFPWIRPWNVTPIPWLGIHPSCKRTSNWLQRDFCCPARCCVRVAVFTERVLAQKKLTVSRYFNIANNACDNAPNIKLK